MALARRRFVRRRHLQPLRHAAQKAQRRCCSTKPDIAIALAKLAAIADRVTTLSLGGQATVANDRPARIPNRQCALHDSALATSSYRARRNPRLTASTLRATASRTRVRYVNSVPYPIAKSDAVVVDRDQL